MMLLGLDEDYVSCHMDSENVGNESVRDVLHDNVDLFYQYSSDLFFIEANMLYLYAVKKTPQTLIGEMMGVSQPAVSKRLNSALGKLKLLIDAPEKDRELVRADLEKVVDSPLDLESMIMYYELKTYNLVSEITGIKPTTISNTVKRNIKIMAKIIVTSEKRGLDNLDDKTIERYIVSKRYHDHFVRITESVNYGDYTFKGSLEEEAYNV